MSGALVTGSARGIGKAIVLGLAGAGYDVAVHYRSSAAEAEMVRAQAEALGVRAVTVAGDLRDLARAGEVVAEADAALGGLYVLVNNVGTYAHGPIAAMGTDEWEDVLESNLSATFATCQAVVPLLRARGGGRIVNLGSAGSQNLVARPNLTAYGIAKTGVVLLTKALARAEAAHGITVNVVAPGVIDNSVDLPSAPIPAGRLGRVEEVAAAVLYFVAPESGYVTGQVLEVAGGWNL